MRAVDRETRKVLIVSFHFPPTNSIAAVRVGKFAKYLPQFGWEPVVLTAGDVREYSQSLPLEVKEARVHRVPYSILASGISHKLGQGHDTVPQQTSRVPSWRRIIYRLLGLGRPVFALPAIRMLALEPVGWHRPAVRMGLEILGRQKIDAIFSSYGPSVAHMVASRLHRESGIPWVAEFRDLWSLNHNVRKVQPFHSFEKRLERKVTKSSELLITVSEPLADQLGALHSKKAVTIPNGFDQEDYLDDVPLTAAFTITYTGNIYPGRQDPSPLFEALARLNGKERLSPDRFEVRFFGGSTLVSLLPAIRRYRLEGIVKICGPVPFKESVRRQKESTVLLSLGWCDPTQKGVYTAKVFEYLGARRPILGIGLTGDVVDELLEETGTGVMLSHADDVEALLSQWLSEFEQSGTITSRYKPDETAICQYTRERQAGRLAQLLEEASGHRPL